MMSFLRMIFVILLCIPVAYVALRLIVSLIDKTLTEAKPGTERNDEGNIHHDRGTGRFR